jgi:hypothetical protein
MGIEQIGREKWMIRMFGIVFRGEFHFFGWPAGSCRGAGEFSLGERELVDHGRRPGGELAATVLLFPAVLATGRRGLGCPIEDCPKIARENCFLFKVEQPLLGRCARVFIEQAKQLCVRGTAQQKLGSRPEKWIELVEAVFFPIFRSTNVDLAIQTIGNTLWVRLTGSAYSARIWKAW